MKNKNSFIEELKNDRDFIKTQNNNITQFLLENCMENIKILNASGGTTYLYVVPPFLIGYPVYDIEIISKLVNKKLKKLKLTTLFIKPNKIQILWGSNVC